MANNGIPAGLEEDDYDYEDSDGFVFSDSIKKVPEQTDFKPISSSVNANLYKGEYSNIKSPTPTVYLASPDVALDDLRIAVIEGKEDQIEPILKHGIDVDTILKGNWTALMYACANGHPEIAENLIERGADVNFKKHHFTPLMALCSSDSKKSEEKFKIFQILIAKEASINDWDRYHMTPLMFAARENHTEIVEELVTLHASLNKADNKGWTALCWAAHKGHGKIARILIEAGADQTISTKDGETADKVAQNAGYDQVAKVLQTMKDSEGEFNSEKLDMLQQEQPQPNDPCSYEKDENDSRQCSHFGDLEMFLIGLNLQEWVSLFQYHQVDFADLLLLTDAELIQMGVDKLGVRKVILDRAQIVHNKKWEHSSLPNLKGQKYISCPDAVQLMANIASHVHYIESSIRYLRRQIVQDPKILELGQESANVTRLLDETILSYKRSGSLKEEINGLRSHLFKIKDNVDLLPGDLIDGPLRIPKSSFWVNPLIVLGIGTFAIGCYAAFKRPIFFRQ